MADLAGKTVVVTGASSGIGRATAQHAAAAGATVVLTARRAGVLSELSHDIEGRGGTAIWVEADVSKAGAVENIVQQAVQRTGRLDVLVNNAGVIDPIARLAESDTAAWGRVIDTNLKGVYFGMRYAIPAMLAQGGGTIINLSSGAAIGALEGWSHYCASKAAVRSLTMVTDKEYRARGIRVLGLSPGTVATDMQAQIRTSGINPVSQLRPDSHIPPEWAAYAILWLISPEADDHLGTDFSLKSPEGLKAVGLDSLNTKTKTTVS